MSGLTDLVIDPSFPDLKPDFSYLEPYLDGKPLQKIIEENHILQSTKRAKTIEESDGYLWISADNQGCLADWQWLMIDFFSNIAKGFKGRFLHLGDLNDPLYEYGADGEIVTKELTDPEGFAMWRKNLATRYRDLESGEEKFAVHVYPDDSVQILAQRCALKKFGGDLFDDVQDDHAQSIIFPGSRIFKSGVEQTRLVTEKLTEEENEYLKRELAKRPLFYRTKTKWGFSHTAGPLPIQSIKDLENHDIYKDIEIDGETVSVKDGTITDMLTWGLKKKANIDGIERNFRYYPTKRIEETMKRLEIEHWEIGHSGVADLVWERDGILIPEIDQVQRYKTLGRLIVLGGTEARGCENPRSGADRRGPNTYGAYSMLKLDDHSGQQLIGDMGKNANPISFKHKPLVEIVEKITEEQKLAEKIKKDVEIQTKERNAFETEMHDFFMNEGYDHMLQDLVDGTLPKKVVEQTNGNFFKSKLRNIGNDNEKEWVIQELHLHPQMLKYFGIDITR